MAACSFVLDCVNAHSRLRIGLDVDMGGCLFVMLCGFRFISARMRGGWFMTARCFGCGYGRLVGLLNAVIWLECSR